MSRILPITVPYLPFSKYRYSMEPSGVVLNVSTYSRAFHRSRARARVPNSFRHLSVRTSLFTDRYSLTYRERSPDLASRCEYLKRIPFRNWSLLPFLLHLQHNKVSPSVKTSTSKSRRFVISSNLKHPNRVLMTRRIQSRQDGAGPSLLRHVQAVQGRHLEARVFPS